MATKQTALPKRMYRNEVVHRAMGNESMEYMIGAGFMLKPGKRGRHFNTVFPRYSGVLVLRGAGRYIDWKGREFKTSPGCFFQRLPGKKHSTYHPLGSDWAECFVNLPQPLFRAMTSLGCLNANRPVLYPGLHLDLVLRFDQLTKQLSQAAESELPKLSIRIHELIVDIHDMDRKNRELDESAKQIEIAARKLTQDFAGRIKLPQLAEEIGMGYENFRKLFREHFGISPGNYHIHRRMEKARSMLAMEDTSVQKVAFALGYPNAFAFSKQFKKVMGAPPSKFLRVP